MTAWAFAGTLLLLGYAATTTITIPSWGAANLIEILWMLTGIGMLLVSGIYAMPRVYGDYVLSTRVPDAFTPAAIILAYGRIRREIVRIAQGFIVTTIGGYACLTPPPVPGPTIVSLSALVLTFGLFLLGILTALQSVLDRRDASQIERTLIHVDIEVPDEGVKADAKTGSGNGLKGTISGEVEISDITEK